MEAVHHWLADNQIWVAFAVMAVWLGLGRLIVGNADLSPVNVVIAFVGAYGGWLVAQVVSATYYNSAELLRARRAESHEIAMDALARATASIAAEPCFRPSPTATTHQN